ncbi:MAG: DUF2336 domain-containing protein [Rhizobiales bacterium]|nr:DUF2336 domain-containing protein [Hyphomicrobiales bacterium]MBI3673187.1 DUF2336 domain-containing protein [Hyphomicrobiales bacterium]
MNDEASPGLDTSIFNEVLDNGTLPARLALARQLAAFLADPDVTATERDQVVPTALKLTADPDEAVRRALAEGLAGLAQLNADILFAIIADEDDIALPFLSATPALNHWHMLAVLRVGDEARQATIAARLDLSPEAKAQIIRKAPLSPCLALFDNASVILDDADYQALFGRLGQAPAMAERLLGRTDLPLDIRILLAKRASNRMHQLMAERGWVAANDAAEIVADAEETAILRILVEASDSELARTVPFLIGKGLLTPSIIVRAACLGELHVVERALADLAGVALARARDLMAGKGFAGFKGLLAKSGLPSSCHGILQAACHVARDEAEEGVILDAEGFGRRLVEALMTRYETMPLRERAQHLDFVGRFAEDRVRLIARRLKADIVRAA